MDNLCHTLLGAACGEAGLKRRTRYGNATLMIASNLPDLDVLVFATSVPALEFRRGWTHGTLGQALLPLALAAAVWLVGRRRAGRLSEPPLHFGWLVALSYVGVLLHVLFDLLNTYGIRLLAPFDWRWFYGDAVFIVDPWLWLALGLGVWRARRLRSPRGARAALAVAACYVAAMVASAQAARALVASAWRELDGRPPHALMVGPVAFNPFVREVIVDAGGRYRTGTFTWWPRKVRFSSEEVPANDVDPRAAAARRQREVRGFLVWSRFPFWTFEPAGDLTRATVADMRFRVVGGRFGVSVLIDPGAD